MGWMFPLLAVLSLMMNGSMHLRRLHRVSRGVSSIERGPPATTMPMNQNKPAKTPIIAATAPPIPIEDDNSPFGYIAGEIRRQIKTQSDYPDSSYTLGLTKTDNSGDTIAAESMLKPKKKRKEEEKPAPTIKRPKYVEPYYAKVEPAAVADKRSAIKEATSSKITQEATTPKINQKTIPSNINKEALSPDASFSACLLIRDDNDILNEWIAYHYHVLKMRRLIVAVDPGSETSPADLLDQWRDTIEIDLWTDQNYMPQEFLDTGSPPAEEIKYITKFKDVSKEEMMGINTHRYRQRVFLTECFKQVKMEKRTWAVHVDTDEYVVPSKFVCGWCVQTRDG